MITDITLENFKGFRYLEIQPKRITAFVGPNGTGKSSVLQAFGLVKQTVEFPRRSPGILMQGPLVYLPGLDALATNGGQDNPVFLFCGDGSGPASAFECRVEFPIADTPDIVTFDRIYVGAALKDLRMALALRGFTQPVYEMRDNPVKDVFLTQGVAQQEAQTATNLCYYPEEVERVSNLLEKVTGTGLRAYTVPSKSVEVKSLAKVGSPINIVAEGFGTNSLIMLLLQLVSANKGATVMIEEPEIHLHPKAQADLAEVLATEALAGDKQVIMTTHSEHITGRLLTLVAERVITPEDLAIYAFEKDDKTGVCSAKPLKISGEGGVEGGIRDFFATNLAEMNRYVEAQFAQLNSSE